MAPGSAHPSGVPYEGTLPSVSELSEVPDSVIEILERPANGTAPPVPDIIPAGERHNELVRAGGAVVRKGATVDEVFAELCGRSTWAGACCRRPRPMCATWRTTW